MRERITASQQVSRSAYQRSEPISRRADQPTSVRIAGVDAGQCSPGAAGLIHVVTPSEVDDFKARLDTLFEDTNLGVASCGGVSANDRSSWATFYNAWKGFAAQSTGFFSTVGAGRTACSYAAQLDGWRDKLRAINCALPGPATIANVGAEDALTDTLKWVAIGALAVGGTLVLLSYAPEIKALLPGKR